MSKLVRTVTLEAADAVKAAVGNITKREALAFKAGGWASLPIDYVFERYALPYARKNFSEKGFYNKISQFGSTSSRTLARDRIAFSGKFRRNKMPAKRSYYNNNNAVNKRLRRVEAMARANRPEMKTITWSSVGTVVNGTQNVLDITSIAQGTGVNERVGQHIKVWRIEIRGSSFNSLDHYILQKHGTINPVYSSFGTGQYAFLDDGVSNTQFTEWLSFRNDAVGWGTLSNNREVLRFPKGIIVKYDDAVNAPQQNGLLFVSRNTSTTDYSQNYSIRMWFTDN